MAENSHLIPRVIGLIKDETARTVLKYILNTGLYPEGTFFEDLQEIKIDLYHAHNVTKAITEDIFLKICSLIENNKAYQSIPLRIPATN